MKQFYSIAVLLVFMANTGMAQSEKNAQLSADDPSGLQNDNSSQIRADRPDDPYDITNAKALGIFYAEDQLAALEDYTVNNTYRPREMFYYKYTIEAKNNFTIPPEKNCSVTSAKRVHLKPGFHAQKGAVFIAKINAENVRKPEDEVRSDLDVMVYPNPFMERITIRSGNTNDSLTVVISDLSGRTVHRKTVTDSGELMLSGLQHLKSGIYIVTGAKDGKVIFTSKLVKR